MPRLLLLLVVRLALFVLVLSTTAVRAESFGSVQSLPLVAPAGSQFPHLFARGSQVYMSWLQQGEAGRASLWFSVLNDERWTPPQRIAEGDNWFVNWADFPALTVLADGTLVAYWLQKSAPDSYAYDIQLSFSTDLGRHWSAPIRPHDDNSHTEHGFVSLLPQADNSLSMVWLDGRESVSHHERMQLRHARFDSAGKKLSEQVIDSDTCTCCQTSAIALPRRTPPDSGPGILVAYRDHAAAEIRDIAVVRWQDGRWSEPATVHADNWEIPGCPVNGPALAQADGQAAVVWYTGAQQQPRVQLAFAAADGLHFGSPVRLDGGAAIGRVGLVMADATTAIASWLERQGEQAVWWLRQVRLEPAPAAQSTAKPVLMAAKPVVQVSLARSSGFPRLALQDRHLVLAWTELTEGQAPQVRTARVPLSALQP